jgi:hypothetical protein
MTRGDGWGPGPAIPPRTPDRRPPGAGARARAAPTRAPMQMTPRHSPAVTGAGASLRGQIIRGKKKTSKTTIEISCENYPRNHRNAIEKRLENHRKTTQ